MEGERIVCGEASGHTHHIRCISLFLAVGGPMVRLHTAIVASILLVALSAGSLLADPTTPEQAELVVKGWVKTVDAPLGTVLGGLVREVAVHDDENGEPVYYIVYLEPSGFVIVPADDLVEPIVGFVEEGTYDPSPENPLGALVSRDLRGRVSEVRNMAEPVPEVHRRVRVSRAYRSRCGNMRSRRTRCLGRPRRSP